VSVDTNGTIKTWDLRMNACVQTIAGSSAALGPITSSAFDSHNKQVRWAARACGVCWLGGVASDGGSARAIAVALAPSELSYYLFAP
jgi:hypothetical protein